MMPRIFGAALLIVPPVVGLYWWLRYTRHDNEWGELVLATLLGTVLVLLGLAWVGLAVGLVSGSIG